jgi:hypothetical protein
MASNPGKTRLPSTLLNGTGLAAGRELKNLAVDKTYG